MWLPLTSRTLRWLLEPGDAADDIVDPRTCGVHKDACPHRADVAGALVAHLDDPTAVVTPCTDAGGARQDLSALFGSIEGV